MVPRRGNGAGAAVLLIAAAGCSSGHHSGRSQRPGEKPSYEQLVAKNYKVLTAKQTRELTAFAENLHACMAKRLRLGEPRPVLTKIVMDLPAGSSIQAVAQTGIRCGTKLGGPPPGASLQVRKHAVVLYLPKHCLLDHKVTRQLRAGKSH
jgi:hypothetical protein